MTATFTPGPWRISEDDLGFMTIRTGERNSAPDADLVASVYDEQDAHLIKAAPDLYAELQQFVNGVETGMIDSLADDILANVTRRAKAALAKAKGETA